MKLSAFQRQSAIGARCVSYFYIGWLTERIPTVETGSAQHDTLTGERSSCSKGVTENLWDEIDPASLLLHNLCPQQVTMKSTKASLTETIQYRCRGKVLASETRELASVSRGKIRPGEGEEWLNEQMYVPPLPPTNLRGCNLINVLYHVYVSKSSDYANYGSMTNLSHSLSSW